MSTQKGRVAEQLLAEILKSKGHTIIATNYTCIGGEVDIITLYKGVIIFWEVKLRLKKIFKWPLSRYKILKVKNCANKFLQRKKLEKYPYLFALYLMYVKGYKVQGVVRVF